MSSTVSKSGNVLQKPLGYCSLMETRPTKHYVKEWRKKRGLSQDKLAAEVSATKSAISKIESGAQKLDIDWMERIAHALNVQPADLLVGPDKLAQSTPLKLPQKPIPILGEVAAGVWIEADLFEGVEPEHSTLIGCDTRYPADKQYLLRINGESLNKIAQNGDLVLCINYLDANIEPKIGDVAVVERTLGGYGGAIERTVKRLTKHNGVIELTPESTDPRFQAPICYTDTDPEATEVTIKAKVLGVYKVF